MVRRISDSSRSYCYAGCGAWQALCQQLPVVLLLIAITAVSAMPVAAEEYLLEYSVSASQSHDDNINLSPGGVAVTGAVLAVPVYFTGRSATTSYRVGGEVSTHHYDLEEFDSDNQRIDGEISHKLEKSSLNAEASYIRDTTRDSEFLDTGVIGPSAIRREQAKAKFEGTHSLTERSGLVAAIEGSDVTYDSNRLSDYEYINSYAGWRFRATGRTEWGLQAGASRFSSDSGIQSLRSDGISAQGVLDAQLNERVTLSVQSGWIKLENDVGGAPDAIDATSDSENSYLFDGSLTYKAERAQWKLALISRPSPSGFGVLLNTNRLDADYRYRASQRLTFEMSAKVGTQEVQGDSAALTLSRDRDFFNGSARVALKLNPRWSLAASYVYRWQDSELFAEEADSNAAFVSVLYEPIMKIWSR